MGSEPTIINRRKPHLCDAEHPCPYRIDWIACECNRPFRGDPAEWWGWHTEGGRPMIDRGTAKWVSAHLELGVWYMDRYETMGALDRAADEPEPDAERIGALYLDADTLRRQGMALREACMAARAAREEAPAGPSSTAKEPRSE